MMSGRRPGDRIEAVYALLDANTPKSISFLQEKTPWRFLFLVMLSAQCTDRNVMRVRDELFSKFPSLGDFAGADVAQIEDSIRTLGLYKVKAKSLKTSAKELLERFSGAVPKSFEDLTSLPGVGRKTANCVRGEVFGLPAIICDTHFLRLMNRLGFIRTHDAEDAERFFSKRVAKDRQYRFSMSANYYARNVCKSRSPGCAECVLAGYCEFKGY